MMKKIIIKTKTITLVQLLKFQGYISTGGMIDLFIEENKILINNKPPTAKRQKILLGDIISINNNKFELKRL